MRRLDKGLRRGTALPLPAKKERGSGEKEIENEKKKEANCDSIRLSFDVIPRSVKSIDWGWPPFCPWVQTRHHPVGYALQQIETDRKNGSMRENRDHDAAIHAHGASSQQRGNINPTRTAFPPPFFVAGPRRNNSGRPIASSPSIGRPAPNRSRPLHPFGAS